MLQLLLSELSNTMLRIRVLSMEGIAILMLIWIVFARLEALSMGLVTRNQKP